MFASHASGDFRLTTKVLGCGGGALVLLLLLLVAGGRFCGHRVARVHHAGTLARLASGRSCENGKSRDVRRYVRELVRQRVVLGCWLCYTKRSRKP